MHDHVCSLSLYWDSPSVLGRLEKWRRRAEASGDTLPSAPPETAEPLADPARKAAEDHTPAGTSISGTGSC